MCDSARSRGEEVMFLKGEHIGQRPGGWEERHSLEQEELRGVRAVEGSKGSIMEGRTKLGIWIYPKDIGAPREGLQLEKNSG